MKILAIDTGTYTGYANNYSLDSSGVWDNSLKKNDNKGIRYFRFENAFTAMLARGAELVVYEQVMRHRGTAAAHVYGGMEAILIKQCYKHEIEYIPVPVGTWKKVVVGNGSSTPDVYRRFAQVNLGLKTDSYDEAAALCILEWAQREAILK